MSLAVLFFVVMVLAYGAYQLSQNPTWFHGILYLAMTVGLCGIILYSRGDPRQYWVWPGVPDDAIVVGYSFQEKEALYLWVLREGSQTPESWQLPWSEPAAANLLDAAVAAKTGHMRLGVHFKRTGPGAPGDYVFYPKKMPLPVGKPNDSSNSQPEP